MEDLIIKSGTKIILERGAQIWGPVNNINGPYPDWALVGSKDEPNATFGLFVTNNSDNLGTRGIMVEKFGAGGYGIAIGHHGNNPQNSDATVGLGIDVFKRGVGLRIRKPRDAPSALNDNLVNIQTMSAGTHINLYDSSGAGARIRFQQSQGGTWIIVTQSDGSLVFYFNGEAKFAFRPDGNLDIAGKVRGK